MTETAMFSLRRAVLVMLLFAASGLHAAAPESGGGGTQPSPHQPRETVKFLGAPQTPYGKKNWSSVMMFNNARCRALTPEKVNTASGLELHQFKWLDSDDEIGSLPLEWNHQVGYNPPRADAANVHFTLGGPYFNETVDCEYAQAWLDEKQSMLRVDQRT